MAERFCRALGLKNSLRGRIATGIYREIGIADAPISPSPEDYAPLDLALLRDPERCWALRRASQNAAGQEPFADMQVVTKWRFSPEQRRQPHGKERCCRVVGDQKWPLRRLVGSLF
jgi:hypothetical protein